MQVRSLSFKELQILQLSDRVQIPSASFNVKSRLISHPSATRLPQKMALSLLWIITSVSCAHRKLTHKESFQLKMPPLCSRF